MNTEKDLNVSEQDNTVEQPSFKRVLLNVWNVILEIIIRVAYVFRDLGLGIWKGIKGIGNAFVKFGRRFKEGSIWTKVSHFIMGAGNFARKQYVKGAIFLSLQILFIAFMIASPTSTGTPLGGKALGNFFTLGDYHGMPIDKEFNFEDDLIGLQELKFPIHQHQS